jgi:cell division protein FtsL
MDQNNRQIRDAVRVGQAFLEQYDNNDKSNKCWHLYDALLQMTANYLYQNVDAKDCRFNYQELYDYISNKQHGYKPDDDARKKINGLFKKLTELLKETRIEHVAKSLNLNLQPTIVKDSTSGRGNKATLWIEAKPLMQDKTNEQVEETENKTAKPSNPTQHIEYYVEKTPKLPLWSRWAENREFQGWSRAVLILCAVLPGVLLITFALSLMLIPLLQEPFLLHIALYSIAGFVIYYLFFGSILKAFKSNIAIVPDALIPLRLHSAVFELDIEQNPKKIGQRIKKLNIKVYSAKCPICKSKVHLKKGGLMHWGRIIGECDLNPVEHIYSFDHTNLKGVNLR